MITEVLELYYDSRVPSKDALANLIDSYLKVLDTWISELGRSEKHESQSENKTVGTLTIENK
ncbi:3619_t:CDS:2 [Gigaspora margarita]|uniref:3619_t:CDS:1 n=1 Tax=Gigaspora margarita TaxID=4874 RepID=A0ABM8W318_GIGMA|nr:3619_t:CDS:2 [Gigaspora margarita]